MNLVGYKGKTIVVYSETGEPIGEFVSVKTYPSKSKQTVAKLVVLQEIDEFVSTLCHIPSENKDEDISVLQLRIFLIKTFPEGKFAGVISGYNKHKKLYRVR